MNDDRKSILKSGEGMRIDDDVCRLTWQYFTGGFSDVMSVVCAPLISQGLNRNKYVNRYGFPISFGSVNSSMRISNSRAQIS